MTLSYPYHPHAIAQLPPERLRQGIETLIAAYQQTRSSATARLIMRYARALASRAHELGGEDAQVGWQRTARRWSWLAQYAPQETMTLGDAR
jgi:hypothetical protein